MPAHIRPAKGTAKAERQQRRAAIVRAERKAKLAAKSRDGSTCRRCGVYSIACEAAHLVDKQSGGDHGLHSSHQRDYVCLCANCHRGPYSLHSGHVRAEFGPSGGDGPVTFIDQHPGARHGRDPMVDAAVREIERIAAGGEIERPRHGRCAVDGGVHAENPHCRGFRPQ